MNLGRLFVFSFFFTTMACAPMASDPSKFNAQEKTQDIDTHIHSEEDELNLMIESRLEQKRIRENYKAGLISTADACRTGFTVPDAVTPGVVALTFDDGPNPNSTNKILDILKARGVKASFFSLGSRAKVYPSILKRIVDEGHLLANHSHTHKNFQSITQAQTDYEIKTPHNILSPYYGKGKFFRYPYGISSCYGNDVLKSIGYQNFVGWHVDTCDWAMTDGSFSQSEAEACYAPAGPVNFQNHVMGLINASGGGIVLMHDIHMNTANNVNQLILNLQAQKYKFVRVDDKTYFPKLNKDLFRATVEKLKQTQPNQNVPTQIRVLPAVQKTNPAQRPMPKKLPNFEAHEVIFLGE